MLTGGYALRRLGTLPPDPPQQPSPTPLQYSGYPPNGSRLDTTIEPVA